MTRPQDIVRVIRIVQYVGPRDLVEEQISKSIHGTRTFSTRARTGRLDPINVTVVTLGEFPETLGEKIFLHMDATTVSESDE